MIIAISGTPGSGKSTLAKNLAKALHFKHHSAGESMREIAKEKSISILQLSKIAETNSNIDHEIDKRTKELGKKEDDFVIDSRLAWHFIPKSVKIFVKADLEKVAERIFRDMRQDEKENTSVKKTWGNLRRRMESERKRYKKLYDLNYQDEKNYDIVIDTTNLGIGEAKQKALQEIKKYLKRQKNLAKKQNTSKKSSGQSTKSSNDGPQPDRSWRC